MPATACSGTAWGACAALGWALRRASEAEARLRDLEAQVAAPPFRAYRDAGDGHIAPPQLSGCPACGSDASTRRGLRKEEIERGWKVCSRCFNKYES